MAMDERRRLDQNLLRILIQGLILHTVRPIHSDFQLDIKLDAVKYNLHLRH